MVAQIENWARNILVMENILDLDWTRKLEGVPGNITDTYMLCHWEREPVHRLPEYQFNTGEVVHAIGSLFADERRVTFA